MKPLKLTRAMLPNLPDEIFDLFIVTQNDAPLNIFDSQPRGRWFFHFGGLSQEKFSQLYWRRVVLPGEIVFHPHSRSDIDRLVEYYRVGDIQANQARFHGYSPSSRELISRLMLSMVETGKFNAAIVCIFTDKGIRVLDGTHRLAAAFLVLVKNKITIPLDAWIGE